MNLDFILVNDRLYLIEIGARMGATCIPEHLSLYTGNDMYELLINLALNEIPNYSFNYPKIKSACLLLQSNNTGTFKKILISKEILNNKKIKIQLDVKPGNHVEKFITGNHRIGHILTIGNRCNHLLQKVNEQIKIKIE